MSTQELLLRSGGGLQGLIWSKYGIEEGKESPFQKRRREKSGGRRVNSEPLNDIEAAKRKAEAEKASQAEHQESTRSQSACEVVVRNKIGEEGGPTIEVVDVLSKMKLDPGAELEISPPSPEAERVASSEKPPSSSDDSPRSPAYLHIIRNDSFDLMLQKKIRNEYVGARMVDGQIVLDDAKNENAKET